MILYKRIVLPFDNIEVTAVCTSVYAYILRFLYRLCQEKFVALFVAHTADVYKTQ